MQVPSNWLWIGGRGVVLTLAVVVLGLALRGGSALHAKYERIQEGMLLEDVEALFGEPGEVYEPDIPEDPLPGTYWRWQRGGAAVIVVIDPESSAVSARYFEDPARQVFFLRR
jgi:hypothetical protein